MTSGGVTKTLSQLSVQAGCALLGVPGVIIGPLLAGAAAWGGKYLMDPNQASGFDAAGTTIAGLLTNLASAAAEGAIGSITPGRNGDLERAGAAAILHGLRFGRDRLKGAAKSFTTADVEEWFDAWGRRLTRGLKEDPEALFRVGEEPDPVDWPTAEKDVWWAAFERVLLRWAAEEQFVRKELPADLKDLLREELQGWVVAAFPHVLRDEGQRRAWIGYQQRYFEHLSRQGAETYEAIEALAQRVAELGEFLQVREPVLPLIPASRRVRKETARPMQRDIELLRAYRRATPMLGRKEQLAGFLNWVMEPGAEVSVRVLVGGAGAGKTRFAVELLLEVERLGQGWWHAGFLPSGELENAAMWSRPTLVVIDYAAVSAVGIRRWLKQVADCEAKHPLRVLLLERVASNDEGWWKELRQHRESGWYEGMFAEEEPVRVDRLAKDWRDRFELLALTMDQGARLRGVKMPSIPVDRPEFRELLQGEMFGDPLYVQMAALTALDGEKFPRMVDVLSLRRTDLAFHVADQERMWLERFCSGGSDSGKAFLRHMLAVAILAGGKGADGGEDRYGLEEGETLAVIAQEAAACGVAYEPAQCRMDLQKANGGPGVPAVTPDIVGEAFVLAAFAGARREEGAGAVRRLGARAVPSLIRMAQDFAIEDVMGGKKVGESALVWLEALIADGEARDLGLVGAIDAAMPHQTEVLRDAGVRVTRRLLDSLGDSEDEDVVAERARLWNNLSVRLSDVGRTEDALLASEEASQAYRKLAAARPDSYLPDLAGALNNWGIMLSAVGLAEDALLASEEAVRIRRKLASARPASYIPDLASSLNNWGILLRAVGRADDALLASEETVGIFRGLASAEPNRYLPEFAMSLHTWGTMLSAAGRAEDALLALEESVKIRRKLAASRPDSCLPDLASSLANLGNKLSDVGRAEDALRAADESVQIYRKLAAARPDSYLPNLAMVLNNCGNMLTDVGRAEDALRAADESVQIYRKLAAARPDSYLADLSGSLNNIGIILRAVGRAEDALLASEEAVQIRRKLAAARPDSYLPDLAMALNNLGNTLNDVGRVEDALLASEEGVQIRRKLAAARPAAFGADLARSLCVTARCLVHLGCKNEAVNRAGEAVAVLRPHFFRNRGGNAGLMKVSVQLYLQTCDAAGVSPDPALLEGLVEKEISRRPEARVTALRRWRRRGQRCRGSACAGSRR